MNTTRAFSVAAALLATLGVVGLLSTGDSASNPQAEPEELDSFNTWILHALERGIRYGEPEDIDDDVLRDDEEALFVGGDDEDVKQAMGFFDVSSGSWDVSPLDPKSDDDDVTPA